MPAHLVSMAIFDDSDEEETDQALETLGHNSFSAEKDIFLDQFKDSLVWNF